MMQVSFLIIQTSHIFLILVQTTQFLKQLIITIYCKSKWRSKHIFFGKKEYTNILVYVRQVPPRKQGWRLPFINFKRWGTFMMIFPIIRTTKYTYKVWDCRSYDTLLSPFHQCFHSSSRAACVADGLRMMLKAAVLLVLVLLLAAASLLRAQAQSTLLSLSKSTPR
jgi:hypothetical protein